MRSIPFAPFLLVSGTLIIRGWGSCHRVVEWGVSDDGSVGYTFSTQPKCSPFRPDYDQFTVQCKIYGVTLVHMKAKCPTEDAPPLKALYRSWRAHGVV